MSRSKGLTSFPQPKDLLVASAQCQICNYLVDRLKWRSKTINLGDQQDIARYHGHGLLSREQLPFLGHSTRRI